MSASGVAKPVVLTYEDYAALPADGRRYELLQGELQVNPAPSTRHQRVSRDLLVALHTHVERNQLGEVFSAPIDVLLERTTVVQPDLVFVSAERTGIVGDRGIEGPPDLIVEVLSPSTERVDRGAKLQLYARHGVRHYWIVDPAADTLAEHVLDQRDYVLRETYATSAKFVSALFPNLEIALDGILRR